MPAVSWRPPPMPHIARIFYPCVSDNSMEPEQSDAEPPTNRTYIFLWPLNNCVVCRVGEWRRLTSSVDGWVAAQWLAVPGKTLRRWWEVSLTRDNFCCVVRGVTILMNLNYPKHEGTRTNIFYWMLWIFDWNLSVILNLFCLLTPILSTTNILRRIWTFKNHLMF